MTVVFPVCRKDSPDLLRLLRWLKKLHPSRMDDHDAVIVADADTPYRDVLEARSMAESMFGVVHVLTTEESVQGWPQGSNALFKLACQECTCGPWLWCEADCVPLKATWLDDIEAAYKAGGKPFMGHVYQTNNPKFPATVMSGVAVYPPNALDYLAPFLDGPKAWDVASASVVVPLAHHTPAIQHFWGQPNLPPTFAHAKTPRSPVNTFTLANLQQGAVLFHRNKDGTLIDLLSGNRVTELSQRELRVVSLRRAGDIVSILPLLQRRAMQGAMVKLVVHSEFVPLLEGTSLVSPIEWTGNWEECLAAAIAHSAINAQVYGKGVKIPRHPANFATEAWRLLGVRWNRYLPLEFDRRSYEREFDLAGRVFTTDKPKVLVKLHGHSSPFPHRDALWNKLREVDGIELVDLDSVVCERIYDLLGLMDRASCLVSSDTVTLHLNRSHKIPTVALVNDSKWGASPMVGNTIYRVNYARVPEAINTIADRVHSASRPHVNPNGIVLAYSKWEPRDERTRRRHASAYQTWERLGARLFPYQEGRNSSTIGDASRLPFIKDMINAAATTGGEDIIAITNNDIWFGNGLREEVIQSCRDFGCFWSYRSINRNGETDNGVDFVAFTRRWWDLHLHLFPDFLLGSIWWDDIMCRIMQWSGCQERQRLYYHEPHPGALQTRPESPHMRHAENLANRWMSIHDELREKPIDLLKTL